MGYFYANVTCGKARPRQVQGHAGEWSRARLFRWEKQILWGEICLSAHTEDRFVFFVVIAHLQHHLSETPDVSVTATRAFMSRNQCASCPRVLPGATHRAKDDRARACMRLCVRACVGGRNSELHCLPLWEQPPTFTLACAQWHRARLPLAWRTRTRWPDNFSLCTDVALLRWHLIVLFIRNSSQVCWSINLPAERGCR